jgi:predicted metal-dependent hydrolase
MPARRQRPREPRTIDLRAEHGAARVRIEVREVTSAKLLRLRIRQDGTIRVSVPPRTSDRHIDGFIAEHQGWLARALAEREARSSRLGLAAPGKVPIAGELRPIVRAHGSRPQAFLAYLDGETVVGLRGPRASEAAALDRFLRTLARGRALELLHRHEPTVGVRATRLRIADPLTRWGSASTTGTISFSWRLALAPAFVFRYVAVHELCHLLEPNHSPRFWSQVARELPDYALGRSWLREHGLELRSWQPSAALAAR